MKFEPRPFEIGMEKEISFEAVNDKGQTFALCIGQLVIDRLAALDKIDLGFGPTIPSGWCVVPEYSEALVEIVTPPTTIDRADEQLQKLDMLAERIDRIAHSEAPQHHKRLFKYNSRAVMNGTSSTDLYLMPDGEVLTDSEAPEKVVLEDYRKFAIANRGLTYDIASYREHGVGIYNSLSSFHMTFHPEYTTNNALNEFKYINFLHHLDSIVEVYKRYDQGNKTITREGQYYHAPQNIRDIFLDALYGNLYSDYISHRYVPASSPTAEKDNLNYTGATINAYFGTRPADGSDAGFRQWSSVNYRPRFTKDDLPLIEVRAFGSNFPATLAGAFVQHLGALDKFLTTQYG